MAARRDTFIPPRRNERVRAILAPLAPVLLRRLGHVERVEVAPDDMARLERLRDERVVLTCNHPTLIEPVVIFHLATLAGLWFHTLTGRELFDAGRGLVGRLIQPIGAYSVARGTPDRESFRATRALLSEPGAKLVAFPEGEVYTANDALLPFRAGVAQLAFWGQEDADRSANPGPIHLLPVAVQYTYTRDMTAAIRRALAACEAHLGVSAEGATDDYARLLRLGDAVVDRLERSYNLPQRPGDSLTARVETLRESLMARVAAALGVQPPAHAALPDRVRFLWNALYAAQRPPDAPLSGYDRRLHAQHAALARCLCHDMSRVHNALALTGDYVQESPTTERMMDTLQRLEFEVFGKPRTRGPRVARIRVGEPVSARDHWAAYRADKKATVAAVTRLLEERVAGLLHRNEG